MFFLRQQGRLMPSQGLQRSKQPYIGHCNQKRPEAGPCTFRVDVFLVELKQVDCILHVPNVLWVDQFQGSNRLCYRPFSRWLLTCLTCSICSTRCLLHRVKEDPPIKACMYLSHRDLVQRVPALGGSSSNRQSATSILACRAGTWLLGYSVLKWIWCGSTSLAPTRGHAS